MRAQSAAATPKHNTLPTFTMAAATPLTCQIGATGAIGATQVECTTTSVQYDDASEACTTEGHSCLTGKFEGGVNAAYGCFPNTHIEPYKEAIVTACNEDPNCVKYNPDGPKNGFTVCTTDSCNSCDNLVNGAGALAPSLALLAVTLLAIAFGL